ncbi:hypothetical protein ABWK57_14165 [Streptomyces sp. NPDC094045]|uniref:hypothetical protein n=1 Tax=unclassified Streptomyces TaxID=2593676 RepID=UPI003393BAE8
MIETVKTYHREVDLRDPIQAKVVYDLIPNSLTYIGYWDENGDPHEMNLAPLDLVALVNMLTEARNAKFPEMTA